MIANIRLFSDSDNSSVPGEVQLATNHDGNLIVITLQNPYRRVVVYKREIIATLAALDLAERQTFNIQRIGEQ